MLDIDVNALRSRLRNQHLLLTEPERAWLLERLDREFRPKRRFGFYWVVLKLENYRGPPPIGEPTWPWIDTHSGEPYYGMNRQQVALHNPGATGPQWFCFGSYWNETAFEYISEERLPSLKSVR